MRDPITGQDRDGDCVVAVVKGPDFVHVTFEAAVAIEIGGGVVRSVSLDPSANRRESNKEDDNPPR